MAKKSIIPRKPPESGWFHLPTGQSDTAIVFVHGLFSSSAQCWTNKNSTYWPALVRDDTRFAGIACFLGGYFTAIDSTSYRISDCANELFALLSRHPSSGVTSPLAFKNLIFVCHSLGGLVTRYMLESKREAFRNKHIGLVLIASPSLGNELAYKLRSLFRLYKNKLIEQLIAGSESTIDLDRRFRDLCDQKEIEIIGVEAVEHQSYWHLKYLPFFKPLVPAASASRYFGMPRVLPQTNHSSICKPSDISHVSHLLLVDFLQRFNREHQISPPSITVPKNGITGALPPLDANSPKQGSALFDIYETRHEQYYVTREIDSAVEQDLTYRSVWLCGPPGAGKTSIMRRQAMVHNQDPIDVYLGAYGSCGSIDGFLVELYSQSVLRFNEQVLPGLGRPSLIREIARILVKQSRSSRLVLTIDEFPYASSPAFLREALECIVGILEQANRFANGADIRLMICSLKEPMRQEAEISNKLAEHLHLRTVPGWTKEELWALCELVRSSLNIEGLSDLQLDQLIRTDNASPRLIKNFFRSYSHGQSFASAIYHAHQEIVERSE